MTRTGRRARGLGALGSGILFAATTPPLDLHGCVLIGLVGAALTFEADEDAPARVHAAYGWLFGLGANLVALRFVPEVIVRFTPLPLPAGYLALLLLAGAQALPWAAGAIVTHLVRRANLLPMWLAYGIGVYVATFVPAVFPWTPAGGLTPWPALVQVAEVVGERGVSFLLATAAGLAAHAIVCARAGLRGQGHAGRKRTASAMLGLAVAIVGAMGAWGSLRMSAIERARARSPHARIALVQPAFEASARWDPTRAAMMIDRLTTLTKSAEEQGLDLTIWPESAYPFTLSHATRRSLPGSHAVLQRGVAGPVLTGAYMAGRNGLGFNSAFLATSDGAISKPYDKRHLLWFGETVPLADTFPWLRRVFANGTGLDAGHESVPFVAGAIRATVLNCYEDTLPEAGREAMTLSPNLLVNLTNDAWFVGSSEGELHLRIAALRAIEARRDFVRAVNQGPTTFIDAAGRVRGRYDLPVAGVLHAEVALLDTPATAYTRFGDIPLAILVVAALAPSAATLARRRRRDEERNASPTKAGGRPLP